MDCLGLHSTEGLQSVLISLVIARNKAGQFLSVEERDGWYLPAGRVDAGETFPQGAVREALEESFVNVNLTGVLRFEVSLSPRFSRMRTLFAAVPVDDDASPKKVADKESLGAAWVRVSDLSDGRPIRSHEVIRMFRWAASLDVANAFPINAIRGKGALEKKVRHDKVICPNHFCVSVVIPENSSGARWATVNKTLPTLTLDPRKHQSVSAGLGALCDQLKVVAGNLLAFVHNGPSDPSGKEPGFICFVFTASVDDDQVTNADWSPSTDIVDADMRGIVNDYAQGILVPREYSKLIVEEGTAYQQLTWPLAI